MLKPTGLFKEVGGVAEELDRLGLKPVLVGGMALVVLGSNRVTQDFDFVISKPEDRLQEMLDLFYDRGFELVSKLDLKGNILSTIDNRTIARIRLQLDAPSSVHFFNLKTKLRIDLLFDFPIPAADLTRDAKKTKVTSRTFLIASKKDLIRLKEIAYADRSSPKDAQDLAFLKGRRH